MSYRTVVLFSGALLFATFVAAALLVGRLSERDFATELDREGLRLETAYEVLQGELEHEMLSIADLLASDLEVRRLLSAGAAAVREEGSRGGGEQAVRIRAALARRIMPQWERMRQEIGLRQMHFHLVPDAVSFLRMKAPDEFGDSLARTRHLVPDVQRDGRGRSGFEIGPSYAGIRGVVPVLAPDSDRMIGTLEVGVSLAGHIERLSRQTGVGYGVLLEPWSVTGIMLDAFRPPRIGGSDGDLLLAASRDELADWLAASRLPRYQGRHQSVQLDWHGRPYLLVRFPLHDYLGRMTSGRPPVGSIVVWKDIGEQTESCRRAAERSQRFILIGYLATQLLLLGLLNLSRREWQHQLDVRTAELRDQESELIRLATTDSLTEVFNRRHFLEQLAAQIARLQRLGEGCALMMIDLDHFKRVNDTYGHAVGDEVLRHFARATCRSLRQIDLVGRIGGEEFAVLLPGEGLDGAMRAADRIRQAIASEPTPTAGGPVGVTVSIGVTRLDARDAGPDTALGRADTALYQAKAAGRDRVVSLLPAVDAT